MLILHVRIRLNREQTLVFYCKYVLIYREAAKIQNKNWVYVDLLKMQIARFVM